MRLIKPTLKMKPRNGETITKFLLSATKKSDHIKKYGKTINKNILKEYLFLKESKTKIKIKYLNFQNR